MLIPEVDYADDYIQNVVLFNSGCTTMQLYTIQVRIWPASSLIIRNSEIAAADHSKFTIWEIESEKFPTFVILRLQARLELLEVSNVFRFAPHPPGCCESWETSFGSKSQVNGRIYQVGLSIVVLNRNTHTGLFLVRAARREDRLASIALAGRSA